MLIHAIRDREFLKRGNSGSLNPDWVEWLMCWPVGYTDVDTPSHRLSWRNPSDDPADLPPDNAAHISRLTAIRKNRANRIKALGNGQYPPTAYVMASWGLELIARLGRREFE